jgi:PAS domain S-box-containing protein
MGQLSQLSSEIEFNEGFQIVLNSISIIQAKIQGELSRRSPGENQAWLEAQAALDTARVKLESMAVLTKDIFPSKEAEQDAASVSFPELNPNPVMEIDLDGKITYVNPFVKKTFSDLVKKKVRHPFLAGWDGILDKLKNQPGGNINREVQVDDRFYQQSICYIKGTDRLRVYGLDITERKKMEIALRESLQREHARTAELETIMDTVPAIIWISHDAQCHQMTGNRFSYEFLGAEPGKNVSMSAPVKELPPHHKAYKNGKEVTASEMPMQISAATGKESHDYEFDVVFEDGSLRHLFGNANPLLDGAGRPCGAVSAFIDITERRHAEEALEKAHEELEQRVQARTRELSVKNEQFKIEIEERKRIEQELRVSEEKLKEAIREEKSIRNQLIQAEKLSALARMVASVAHEINNPLQTIKNCIYLVKGETDPASEKSQILEMAASEANRIGDLVAQLRELYKPSKDQTPKAFNVIDILNNVHSLLGPHLLSHHVNWKMTSDTDRAVVEGISDQIKQVFLNICLNAVDAIKRDDGYLTLEVSTIIPGRVCISIEDNGEGILAEDMPHIFEPFFTTKDTGSGLGLSICYEIVKSFNGEILVESKSGVGAKFTVCLPRI